MKTSRTQTWIVALALAAASLPVFAQQAPRTTAPTNAPTNAVGPTASTNRSSATSARTDRQAPRPAATSARTASSGQLALNDFRQITEQNIFNATRTGGRTGRTGGGSTVSVRVDGFSLVGTIESEKGLVALFDGTEPSYKNTAKPGTKIGGFEVKDVQFAGVRLAQGDQTIDLAVGSGMRRVNSGPWEATTDGTSLVTGGRTTERASAFSADTFSGAFADMQPRNNGRQRNNNTRNFDQNMWGGTPTTTPTTSSSGASASPVDVNDVLKRLMEQREKE